MIIFWRLLLAHMLTDFTFQTNKIAAWKRKSVSGILLHSGMFLLLSFFLCVFNENFTSINPDYLLKTWWKLPGWLSILLIFITHFVEDYYRIWSIKKGGSSDNILFFIWDQLIHVIIIFLFSPVSMEGFIPEKWVVVAILFVLVTHFSTILIYYIEEAIFSTELNSERLKGRYWLIIERLIVFSCLILPDKWWATFLIVLLARPFIYNLLKINNFSQLNVIAGTIFTIIFGILARFVVY